MILQRAPAAMLRPFVARLWAAEGDGDAGAAGAAMLEHVLPTGLMHLVVRLGDRPLFLLDAPASPRVPAPACLVGGARSAFYARESGAPSASVGAVLWPGAATLLFGVGADELAQRHTALEDLWGERARHLRDELRELASAEDRIARLEARLGERLPALGGMHPQVAALMHALHQASTIGAAVQASGLAHRQFIVQCRHWVGLKPKTWLKVRRFQRALRAMRASPAASLAEVAAGAGYSDQSHFGRDFLALAGVTPARYRALAPADANHLPQAR